MLGVVAGQVKSSSAHSRVNAARCFRVSMHLGSASSLRTWSSFSLILYGEPFGFEYRFQFGDGQVFMFAREEEEEVGHAQASRCVSVLPMRGAIDTLLTGLSTASVPIMSSAPFSMMCLARVSDEEWVDAGAVDFACSFVFDHFDGFGHCAAAAYYVVEDYCVPVFDRQWFVFEGDVAGCYVSF